MAFQPLLSACCRDLPQQGYMGVNLKLEGCCRVLYLKETLCLCDFTGFEQSLALPWTHRRQRVDYAMWGFLNLKMIVTFLELSPDSHKLRETKETQFVFFLDSREPSSQDYLFIPLL